MQYFAPDKPFLPSERTRASGMATIYRPAAALLTAHVKQRHLKEITRELWPAEKDLELRIKAATAPATMTSAQSLVAMGVPDFLGTLGPASAFANLADRCLQFSFDGVGMILLPSITAAASNADFVGEGAPIPAIAFDTSARLVLKPSKFATISVFTRETFEHTTPTIETVVRATLTASVGLALDAKAFDTNAGTTTRPPGLRYNINAKTASVATPRSEAMGADIATLVTAVATVASNWPIILIASPAQAAALRLWNNPSFNYPVLASSGLAAGVVMAIASNTLAVATDPMPRFEIVRDATVHLDTVPLDITTASVGQTIKTLFQSDLVGLRTVFELSFGLRDANGLAWMTGVSW